MSVFILSYAFITLPLVPSGGARVYDQYTILDSQIIGSHFQTTTHIKLSQVMILKSKICSMIWIIQWQLISA